MATGWNADATGSYYFFSTFGAMLSNQWIASNGQWYYLGNSGAMMRNAWIGNYYVGADGMWIPPTPSAPSISDDKYPCPAGATIKGNRSAKGEWIYRVPTGRSYTRTHAEECFATEQEARASGYRRAGD